LSTTNPGPPRPHPAYVPKFDRPMPAGLATFEANSKILKLIKLKIKIGYIQVVIVSHHSLILIFYFSIGGIGWRRNFWTEFLKI
jgi:hypothetical protein